MPGLLRMAKKPSPATPLPDDAPAEPVLPFPRVGWATSSFALTLRGSTLSFRTNELFEADEELFTHMAGCPVLWE